LSVTMVVLPILTVAPATAVPPAAVV
jgi:hypothetical protein